MVKLNGRVYVIELKMDGDAREALEQIKERGYHEPYRGMEVWLVGVNVSSERGTITEDGWVWEKVVW